MKRQHQSMWAIGLAGLVLVASMGSASAMTEPVLAAPPSPDTFTAISNAMLRPAEIPAPVTSASPWSVSYEIPAGGQDPYPLCIAKNGGFIALATAGTIGYRSESSISQELYVYPSAEAAAEAWQEANARVLKGCRGTYTEGDGSVTVTKGAVASPVGGPAGWWIRTKGYKGSPNDTYLTALLVNNAIQMVYASGNGKALSAAPIHAVSTLTPVLATRYVNAATEPLSQPELLTTAQQQLMQPSDVPAALPYRTPENGGWSGFDSSTPPGFGWVCGLDGKGALAGFGTSFGGQGDVFDLTGEITQVVRVYPDAAAASAAWQRLNKAVLACRTKPARISATEPISNFSAGTSPMSFGGTNGLWWRTLDTYPSPGKQCQTSSGKKVACGQYSVGNYGIYLLVGRSIQQLSYGKGITGLRNVPLQLVTVNQLADQLATRWAAHVS